jgi:hypothetical protein
LEEPIKRLQGFSLYGQIYRKALELESKWFTNWIERLSKEIEIKRLAKSIGSLLSKRFMLIAA